MSKLVPILFAAILAHAVADFDLYKGCNGKTQRKMCIGFNEKGTFSKDCITQKNCMFAASVTIVTGSTFHMEVLASYNGTDDGNHWVALAVSEDEQMGDDGVILCDPYSTTHCNKYWNVDKPSYNSTKTKDTDLADTMSGHQTGAAYGGFTIGFPFEWTAPNGTKVTWGEDKIKNVFMASGPMASDKKTPSKHDKHVTTPPMGKILEDFLKRA